MREFRRNLETRTTYGYLAQAQQLYDWLIRPIRDCSIENQIDTLVFVPDGALRTIPFASLHDGKRFLIQDFAVAVAPGLSLVEPHPIEREKVALAAERAFRVRCRVFRRWTSCRASCAASSRRTRARRC